MKYGSGPARFPLPEMLQYVLEFIATKPPESLSSAQGSQTTLLQPPAEPHVTDAVPQPNGLVNGNRNNWEEDTLPSS